MSIVAVRTRVSAKMLNFFIAILLFYLRFGCSISGIAGISHGIPSRFVKNVEKRKNLMKVKIPHCHFGICPV